MAISKRVRFAAFLASIAVSPFTHALFTATYTGYMFPQVVWLASRLVGATGAEKPAEHAKMAGDINAVVGAIVFAVFTALTYACIVSSTEWMAAAVMPYDNVANEERKKNKNDESVRAPTPPIASPSAIRSNRSGGAIAAVGGGGRGSAIPASLRCDAFHNYHEVHGGSHVNHHYGTVRCKLDDVDEILHTMPNYRSSAA